ncbi:MAG: spore coat protein U domain-containing protein [Syntrophorhabdaceae bacterium]|nr:spore coat protein U domain-containing protein [Syntrophorhabdaceae bacterium]MDD5244823.1 spore coat protein U domain-containing protein [Syntrophorhabdaceae bacterium]
MRSIIIFTTILIILTAIPMCYAASTLSVTATVVSRSNCRFNTGTSSLNFGTLDPGNPSDKTVSASVRFWCGGSAPMATFAITHDSGLYETATDAPRMRNTAVTTEYLPYTLSLNPTSGTVRRFTIQTLTISGTVQGTAFQNAYAGNYSDRVVISIEP